MQYIHLLFIVFLSLAVACSDHEEVIINPPAENEEWLIPSSKVFDGGPGKDGIPSIDNPRFSMANQVDFLNDDDLVLGLVLDGVVKAYPHPILNWHEIVNDQAANKEVAITYCPLTGTGIGWDRTIDGEVTTFGVSGLLYNTNLMPYDRKTNSIWSQQRLECVNGELLGRKAGLYSLVETSWATWKEAFPNSLVMNTETGFTANYQQYPYTDYRENEERLLFPISTTDDRLPLKERTLGVILEGDQRVYTFSKNPDIYTMIEDDLDGIPIVVVSSKDKNFIVAFKVLDNKTFNLVENNFPIILEDNLGVRYDLLGQTSDSLDSNLELLPQFMGFWFSWGTFYQDIDLHVD